MDINDLDEEALAGLRSTLRAQLQQNKLEWWSQEAERRTHQNLLDELEGEEALDKRRGSLAFVKGNVQAMRRSQVDATRQLLFNVTWRMEQLSTAILTRTAMLEELGDEVAPESAGAEDVDLGEGAEES